MIPDVQVDRVHRQGREPGWIASVATAQPMAPEAWHVVVSDRPYDGFDGSDVRVVRMVDGLWHDHGPVEPERDPSIHPDMKGSYAEYVSVARKALKAIPRGASMEVEFTCSRSGGSDEIIPLVTYMAHGDITVGQPVHVPDCVLDQVPSIRFLERSAVDFASMFGVEAYDDASGVSGDLSLRIATDGLRISVTDPETGNTLVLESSLSDGEWEHSVMLEGIEHAADGMETLRRLKDDQVALGSMFEGASDDNMMIVLLGIGNADQVVVNDLHREDEASGRITFMLQPGMIR